MSTHELQSAIALIKSGKKEEGQKILVQYLRVNPTNETAWLWLLETMNNEAQRIAALQQYLKINPGSQTAIKALTFLQAQIKKTPDKPLSSGTEQQSSDLSQPVTTTAVTEVQGISLSATDSLSNVDTDETTPSNQEEDLWILPEIIETPPELSQNLESITEQKPILQPAEAQKATSSVESLANIETRELRKQFSETQDTPVPGKASLGKRILRGFFVSALVLLILGIFGTALLIFTGRLENPFYKINSQQISTLTALQTEKARLQSEVAIEETTIPTETQAAGVTTTPIPVREIYLPAPLYMLAPGEFGDQIWLVDTTGKNVRQITNLMSPVAGFDISPLNGMLAYISGNQLFISSADGSNPQSILQGPSLSNEEDETHWKDKISAPIWSPDGSKLAISMGGIKIISFSDGVISTLIDNHIPTNAEDPADRRIYKPLQWSPDSMKLAAREERPACDRLAIFSTAGDPAILGIGHPNSTLSWNMDSQSLLEAVPSANCDCENGPGMWMIDAVSGEETSLIDIEGKNNYLYVGWPNQIENNQVLYFVGSWSGELCEQMPESSDMLLTVSDAADFTIRTLLRSDKHHIAEALWSPDHNFAMIVDSISRNIIILFTDNSSVALLPTQGYNLRWGIPDSAVPTATPIPFNAAARSDAAPQNLSAIALQSSDLPLFYVEKEEAPPQSAPGLIKSYARSFTLTEESFTRTFLNQIFVFTNDSLANNYFTSLKETRLPKNEPLPILVGDESIASSSLTTNVENIAETYQMVWRYHETVVLLQLQIENSASISSDEIADLARKIQSRLSNVAP